MNNPAKINLDEIEADKSKQAISLKASALRRKEERVIEYHCTIPHGLTKADVMKPEFWRHVSNQLEFHTEIWASFEDGSHLLWLIVLDSGPTWAKVHLIEDIALGAEELKEIDQIREDEESRFKVVYKGPSVRYCVLDTVTNELIFKNGKNEIDAQKKVEELLKRLAK